MHIITLKSINKEIHLSTNHPWLNIDRMSLQHFASLCCITIFLELNNFSILSTFGLCLKYTGRFFATSAHKNTQRHCMYSFTVSTLAKRHTFFKYV